MSNVTTVPIEIVDKASGHVSIMHFVTEERQKGRKLWSREATDKAIAEELTRSGQDLNKIAWRRIASDAFPTNRLFRESWRSDGKKLEVDMGLAQAEHMEEIRRKRDAQLAKKDREWLKEFSRGNIDAADVVEAERQKLRDVPQEIEAEVKKAKTPEELKAVWPVELKD